MRQMETLGAYIPMDRRLAMAKGEELPNRATGAALFADVSGFTPMTGELVKELGPKRGAEELTHRLNTVYGAMTHSVHSYQGSIVNFSGDAITCWFDRDDGRRAIASGLAMLQTQHTFSKPSTGETLSLALKVGVATGPARRFRVGNPLVQYIDVLAGTTLNRMAAAEKQARQGQLVVDATTAGKLKDLVQISHWLGAGQAEAVSDSTDFAIVTALTEPVETTPWLGGRSIGWRLTETQTRPWLLPPVYTRLRSEQAPFLDEIRPAVALFLKFGELDYDTDETAGDKLNFYVQWVQNVLARHSGYLIQLTIGDKGSYLYAAFGAPLAQEDYTDQAVAAAMELRKPPPEVEHITRVQIGLSRGWMHAGAYGSQTRRTYGVLGDETNVAARLMSQARPGQILVTGRIVSAVSQQYQFKPLAPGNLRGKLDTIPVFEVMGRQWGTTHKHQLAQKTPIFGRTAEKSRLQQKFQALLDEGQGAVIIIEGEAGMGKSRLVSEFAATIRAQGLTELSGAGQSMAQQTLYRAWYDVFNTYFNLEADGISPTAQMNDSLARQTRQIQVQNQVKLIAPDQIERLPLLNDILNLNLPHTNLTANLEPAMRHQSLVTLLVTLLRARAKDQPLILLLDDVQWFDSLSWDLTVQLTRSLIASNDPFLLLLATRPLDKTSPEAQQMVALQMPDQTETMTLPPLSPKETVALVTARLGLSAGHLPRPVAEFVRQRAAGNPFFAEELAHALLDQGLIKIEPVSPPSGPAQENKPTNHCLIVGNLAQANQILPETVQSLILARIDRLPPGPQLALKVGAVIGRTFAYEPLYYTLSHQVKVNEDRLKSHLNSLVSADFTLVGNLTLNPTYTFKHIITQEVAYQTLVFVQRQKLHGMVAEWYEQTYGLTNGNLAAESRPISFIYPLLVYHYHQAENYEREQYYARLAGEQAAARFANEEAIAYLSRALQLTPETDYLERYAVLLAREKVHSLQGQRDAQIETLAMLERLAEQLDDDKRAEIALRRSALAEAIGDYTATIKAAQSAIDLAIRANNAEIKARGHLLWGNALWRQGNFQATQQQLKQALTLTADTPELEAHIRRALGLVYWHQGNYETAKDNFEWTLLIFQKLGIKPGEGLALNNLGIILAEQGDPDQAQAYFEQSLLLCQQTGDRKTEGNVLNNLGIIAGRQGDYIPARGHYRRALQIKREVGDRQGEAMVLDNLGDVARYQGNYRQARNYFEQSLLIRQEMGERVGEANVLNNLGNVDHYQGDYQTARQYYEQSLSLRREIGDQQGEGEGLAYLSLLFHHMEDHLSARDRAEQSFKILHHLGDRHLQGYALTHLGHAQSGLGHLDEAIEAYQKAVAVRRKLGEHNRAMEPLAGLARIYLAQGKPHKAQTEVTEILRHLQHRNLDGTEEPFRVYLTCYDVLIAVQQPDAPAILERAYHLLQERVAKLESPILQQSFLTNIAAHRRLVATWQTNRDLTTAEQASSLASSR